MRKIDYFRVWKLHLAGLGLTEISTLMGISTRAARYIVKDQRSKFPREIEIAAMQKVVRRLSRNKIGTKAIISSVWRIYRMRLTVRMIEVITGKKSPTAKPHKRISRKKAALKNIQKKFERVKPPVGIVLASTESNKELFKKEVKKLEKRLVPMTKKAHKATKVKSGREYFNVINVGAMMDACRRKLTES